MLQIKEKIRRRILYYFPGFLAWCHLNVAVLNYDKCYSRGLFECRLHFGSAIHNYYDAIDNGFIAERTLFNFKQTKPTLKACFNYTAWLSAKTFKKSKGLTGNCNKIAWMAVFLFPHKHLLPGYRVRPMSYIIIDYIDQTLHTHVITRCSMIQFSFWRNLLYI